MVVPHRHVESIFQLGGQELASVWNLVAEVRDRLPGRLDTPPDGFNVGPNDGAEAGQTVLHGHVHVIPRYHGDVPDPRGGIRWVIPRKANYWDPAESDPFQQVEFLGFIQSLLEHGEFVSTYKFANRARHFVALESALATRAISTNRQQSALATASAATWTLGFQTIARRFAFMMTSRQDHQAERHFSRLEKRPAHLPATSVRPHQRKERLPLRSNRPAPKARRFHRPRKRRHAKPQAASLYLSLAQSRAVGVRFLIDLLHAIQAL